MKGAKYCSYDFRSGQQKFDSEKDAVIFGILMRLAKSVDPHGYDDADYDEAMLQLKALIPDT